MRRDLVEYVENHDVLYVICVNDGILRNDKCAYFGAASEERALEFFNSIKQHLSEDAKFSTTKLKIDDVMSLSLLYDNNYSNFYIDEIGYISTSELYEIRENIINKYRDLVLNMPISCLYAPIKDNKFVIKTEGTKHIIQSFYTSIEKAKEVECDDVVSIFILDFLNQRLISDPLVYTIDDDIVYGYELYEIIINVWADNQLHGEEIKKYIENDLYIMMQGSKIQCKDNLPAFCVDLDFAKSIVPEGFEVVSLKNNIDRIMSIISNFSSVIIHDGLIDKYCYVIDLYQVLMNRSTDRCKRDTTDFIRKIVKLPKLYTLVSKREDNLDRPFLSPSNTQYNDNRRFNILIFTELENIKEFIDTCNVNANIGLIDNNSMNNIKTLLLIAYHLNIGTIEVCVDAPINDERAKNNYTIPVRDVVKMIPYYDLAISMISNNEEAQINFNKLPIL